MLSTAFFLNAGTASAKPFSSSGAFIYATVREVPSQNADSIEEFSSNKTASEVSIMRKQKQEKEYGQKRRKSQFFTLGQDALHFSTFARRSWNSSRRNPYQIIEATRAKHREAIGDLSIEEKIDEKVQQLKEQLPKQSNLLRSQISELSQKIETSASRAKVSFRKSVEETSTHYFQKTKIPSLTTAVKRRIYQIEAQLRALAINALEQISRRLDWATEYLKQ